MIEKPSAASICTVICGDLGDFETGAGEGGWDRIALGTLTF